MSEFKEPLIQAIHVLWFGSLAADGAVSPEYAQKWFGKDPAFDKLIRKHYLEYIDPAFMGAFDRWAAQDAGLTALIVLLDQFPRNMFRGTARAFAYDKKALATARLALQDERYLRMPSPYAYFCLLPMMHCEDLACQDLGVTAFGRMLDQVTPVHRDMIAGALHYAEAHRDIIARFGRFPHRNALLGRNSSPEETAFLEEPNSSF